MIPPDRTATPTQGALAQGQGAMTSSQRASSPGQESATLGRGPSLYTKIIDPIVLLIFMIAATLYVPVMVGLLSAGIIETCKVAYQFVWQLVVHKSTNGMAESELIAVAIRGIELLLLAPLGYFLLVSLAIYASTCRNPGIDIDARGKLLAVKALSVGMLIGVISTDMVGRILTADGISYKAAICECLAIMVLGAYFTLIERHVGNK